jgi:hypothetical protein
MTKKAKQKYAPTYIYAFQPELCKYPYGEVPDTTKLYHYIIQN